MKVYGVKSGCFFVMGISLMLTLGCGTRQSAGAPDLESGAISAPELALQSEDVPPQASADTPETGVSNDEDKMLHGAHVATVKPGASVSFESDYVAPSEVGEWQDIRLTFISAYDQADLSIEVNTMAGVDMLPTAVDLETSLGLLEREEFTISVKSDVAGVYYLSILVEAQLPDGMTESRAFAQPIRVGTVEPSAQKLEEAEAGVVVLPAHETITD